MRGNQPSLTLGPKQADRAAASSGFKGEPVQLSGLDSKGRAVPGAFGRALAGEGAPEGGRKPKRVRHTTLSASVAVVMQPAVRQLMSELVYAFRGTRWLLAS